MPQHAIACGWLQSGDAAHLHVLPAAVHALRVSRSGPPQHRMPEGCAPEPAVALSADARFVLRAAQVLRQAGWRGNPFLGVKLVDPTWTRARWDRAQAALAQWRRQQARARQQGSGLEALVAGPSNICERTPPEV